MQNTTAILSIAYGETKNVPFRPVITRYEQEGVRGYLAVCRSLGLTICLLAVGGGGCIITPATMRPHRYASLFRSCDWHIFQQMTQTLPCFKQSKYPSIRINDAPILPASKPTTRVHLAK